MRAREEEDSGGDVVRRAAQSKVQAFSSNRKIRSQSKNVSLRDRLFLKLAVTPKLSKFFLQDPG